MLVSYNWLKEYVDKIPEVSELKSILNTRAFEVEGVTQKGDDYQIDIDVLPNRAHDCLSHYGIAKEVSILTGEKFKEISSPVKAELFKSSLGVENKHDKCLRYIAREIENVEVKESPLEIKQKLEVLGEKSINNIVDITNIVMFEIGQPLHAFDKAAFVGNVIHIRGSKEGERIETLDGKDIELDGDTLVIADDQSPLAIGGVKGGKKAQVDESTTTIILEAANFNSTLVRKISQKLGIKTESSKRFENGITPKLAIIAMERVTELILKYASTEETKVSEVIDVYTKESGDYFLGVSGDEVRNLLGSPISDKEIEGVFKKMDFKYKKVKTKEYVTKEIEGFIGRPHIIGASITYDAPNAFDCSSLVAYLYALGGVSIPRNSIDQFVWSEEIPKDQLEAGDLIFSNSHDGSIYQETQDYLKGTPFEAGIDHVGMYLGDGVVIHSTRYEGHTLKENLNESGSFKDITGYGRVIEKDQERFVIEVPSERLDLRIKEDLIEEIGRVYGYENIAEENLDDFDNNPRINTEYYYNNMIRKILSNHGYSEVFTSSFATKGDVKLVKAFANDRPFLKNTNVNNIQEVVERNTKNLNLLGLDEVKVFEIGKVFGKDSEKRKLTLGRSKGDLNETINLLNEELSLNLKGDVNRNVVELDLEYEDTSVTEYGPLELIGDKVYEPISQYPFVLRDIAVWVPEDVTPDTLLSRIKENASELLVNSRLFDEYKKDGKVSYAFQLVFLSHEKTLTDDEVNEVMKKIADSLDDNWEVR
ncbi:MAG: phenylalanyl-tRNA synthetase beta subunit [Candidatus Paceibacteria bacterium]|jgi:phenylalanyl-tRNA synthetase beta subunit